MAAPLLPGRAAGAPSISRRIVAPMGKLQRRTSGETTDLYPVSGETPDAQRRQGADTLCDRAAVHARRGMRAGADMRGERAMKLEQPPYVEQASYPVRFAVEYP